MSILEDMVRWFDGHGVDYVLIGGMALHGYGYSRATKDIDFAVRANQQRAVISHMESLGFETLYQSSGFSNHLHSLGGQRIDFLYLNGPTADAVFRDSRVLPVDTHGGICVVSPEHLVAMKIFACRNAPERKLQELADIRELIRLQKLDKKTMRDYFEKYGQLALWPLVDDGDGQTSGS